MAAQQQRTLWERWTRARGLRWLLIVGLVLAGLVLSFTGDVLEVCEEQLASDSTVVEVCRQPSVADPGVLAFLLLVLVALWPDISSVSIGIVSLTQKVDQQAERTKEVGNEVRQLGVELKQTITQQVSQRQTAVQRVYVGTTATSEPTQVDTASRPEPGETLEEVLRRIRRQPAYQRAGIQRAMEIFDGREKRQVKVALVGAGIDPALLDVEALRPHVEPPQNVSGAPAGAVGSTGTASVGHVLAMAPSAIILPVGVLGESSQLSSVRALSDGIEMALDWNPDVLLIGLQSPPEAGVEGVLSSVSRDLVIVAPAGNDAEATSVWPGIISRVLSVAALTVTGHRAEFSNFGTGVDLAAPGVDIDSLIGVTDDGELVFGRASGTSSAADLVAGSAALLLATGLTQPNEVARVLRRTTKSTEEGLAILDVADAAERLADRPNE